MSGFLNGSRKHNPLDQAQNIFYDAGEAKSPIRRL